MFGFGASAVGFRFRCQHPRRPLPQNDGGPGLLQELLLAPGGGLSQLATLQELRDGSCVLHSGNVKAARRRESLVAFDLSRIPDP